MVYVSTSSLWTDDFDVGIPALFRAGFSGVELSFSPRIRDLNSRISRWGGLGELSIHNYFPRPRTDFVFNLASDAPTVSNRSLAHARKAIDLATRHELRWASFHSGFLLDPKPEELGRPLKVKHLGNREEAYSRFVDRAVRLSKYGLERGVRVLWENNILTPDNFRSFNGNPFLLVRPEEIVEFATLLPSGSGVLLDVAHLSVSCRTLGLDRVSALRELESTVVGLHLSEDSGVLDDGGAISESSWFWGALPSKAEYIVIESKLEGPEDAKKQCEIVGRRLGRRHNSPDPLEEEVNLNHE